MMRIVLTFIRMTMMTSLNVHRSQDEDSSIVIAITTMVVGGSCWAAPFILSTRVLDEPLLHSWFLPLGAVQCAWSCFRPPYKVTSTLTQYLRTPRYCGERSENPWWGNLIHTQKFLERRERQHHGFASPPGLTYLAFSPCSPGLSSHP